MAYSLTGVVRDPDNGKAVVSGVLVQSYRLDTFAPGPTATAASSGVVTLTGLTDGVQYGAYADYNGKHVNVPLMWVPESLASTAYGTTSQLADVVSSATGENAGTSARVARADHRHQIAEGSIVNADVNNAAAIAYSKLNLASSIVNADVNNAAAIAYSKLNLASSIVNADVNASAAIVASKIAAGSFGSGNYTIPGTLVVSGAGATLVDADGTLGDMVVRLRTSGIGGPYLVLDNTNGTAGNRYPGVMFRLNGSNTWMAGIRGDTNWQVYDVAAAATRLGIDTSGNVNIPGPVYALSGSGTLAQSSNTTQSITLSADGTYILAATLVATNTDVHVSHMVHAPGSTNLNVGYVQLLSNSYSLGSIAVATQDGGGQYAINVNSNYIVKVTFTTGAHGAGNATWRYRLLRIS